MLNSKGAFYHVIVRGNQRRDIFRDDQDRLAYLESKAHSWSHWISLEAPTVEVDPDLEVLGAPEVTGGLRHPLDDGVRGGKGHILLFGRPQ